MIVCMEREPGQVVKACAFLSAVHTGYIYIGGDSTYRVGGENGYMQSDRLVLLPLHTQCVIFEPTQGTRNNSKFTNYYVQG